MRVPSLLLLVTLLLLGAEARPAAAQEVEGEGAAGRLRLADQYLQAGQADRAVALLEDLLAAEPTSHPAFERLKDAYVGAGRVPEAVRLVEDRIGRLGPSPPLLAELGRLHTEAGDPAAAERAWAQAVELAPDYTHTYRTLYAVMIQGRLWERARDILLEGRLRLGQEDLYRLELAELHARLGAHGEALQEWGGLLAEDPQRLAFVQGRLGRMLDQEGAAEAFRVALDRLIRQEPLALPYRRLAAWLAAEGGDFEAALDHTRALDRLGREEGAALFAFAEAALQAGALDAALRAYDIIRETHPATPSAPMALLSSAVVFEREGERARERPLSAAGERLPAPYYDEARARYERFLSEHPHHANAPLARHRLALLHLRVYREFAEAERLLSALVAELPPGEAAAAARLSLGEAALLRDDLPRARAHFAGIEGEVRTGELAERARYELALLDFYEGHFEMADARSSAMKRNTTTDVANDAIGLKLLLTEGHGPDSLSIPLREFARAELRRRQHRPADALDALDAWLDAYPEHALADEAHFRRGEALRALARPAEAIALLEALPERFPESHLADRALFAAAEAREFDLRDGPAALAAYTALLVRYPGSLLAPEVRTRIRRLRGDRPAS